jgi:hypothetical protein
MHKAPIKLTVRATTIPAFKLNRSIILPVIGISGNPIRATIVGIRE